MTPVTPSPPSHSRNPMQSLMTSATIRLSTALAGPLPASFRLCSGPAKDLGTPVRIVQIIQGVHNPSAGPTYSVARLAEELRRLGEDASIVTLGTPPEQWPHSAPLRVHGVSTPILGGISLSLLRDIRASAKTPTILHGHGIWRAANLFPLTIPRRSPARLLCSPRGMLSAWSMNFKSHLKTPFWRLFQKPALVRCHCLHATATAEYEDIRSVGLRGPVAIIPNGVDVPAQVAGGKRSRQAVFLSRIDPKKGLDILLPAWCAVAPDHPEWELVVAGPMDGSYAHEIRALAHRLAPPRLRFVGQLVGEEKRSLLAGASLFVLPSYSENFGIAIAEALAHGLPVITTQETPWQELSSRGCGWCIRAEEGALRDTLQDALRRPLSELQGMGDRGRRWMQCGYAWPRIAAQMRSTYEWLLNGSAPPECVVMD